MFTQRGFWIKGILPISKVISHLPHAKDGVRSTKCGDWLEAWTVFHRR